METKENDILGSAIEHSGFSDEDIQSAIEQISADTGFEAKDEIQRRYIYDRSKTWRVRIAGLYQGKPAVLRIENLKLNIEEEQAREAFRQQVKERKGNVRPPDTYAFVSFDESRKHGWSIDESVPGPMLFDPEGDPEFAADRFCSFYRELRRAVPRAFWSGPSDPDQQTFLVEQLHKWELLSREKYHDQHVRHFDILVELERTLLSARLNAFRFQHAHLAGSDVRLGFNGVHIVFANHFWTWRQEAYDVAFPIWNQWLALSDDQRTPEQVARITTTWLTGVGSNLKGLIREEDLRLMLLNRIFGSLLLDAPAQCEHRSPDSIRALEIALVAEARRLLG
jgi:hypothetical protein